MIRSIINTAIVFCFGVLPFAMTAQSSGSLDPSFGQAGFIVPPIGGSIIPQPDNTFRILGYDSLSQFVLWGFKSDGEVDTSFGDAGKKNLLWTTTQAALYFLPDGRIAVLKNGIVDMAGNYSDIPVGMMNADFSVDTTFGEGGICTVNVDYLDIPISVALQANGSLILFGETRKLDWGYEKSEFFLCRLTPEGVLDLSFGQNGVVRPQVSPAVYDWHNSKNVVVQPDGKILIGGWVGKSQSPSFDRQFYLARFNTDGSEDLSFGTGGYVYTAVGSSCTMTRMVLAPDNRIIAVGTSDFSQCAVARYTSGGQLDNSFSGDGKFTTPYIAPVSVEVQPDGKILVGGFDYSFQPEYVRLMRLTGSGVFDNTFSSDGKIEFDFVPMAYDQMEDIALQADGKILVSGRKGNGGEYFVFRLFSGLLIAAEEPFSPFIANARVYPSLIYDQREVNIEFLHEGQIETTGLLVDIFGHTWPVEVADVGDGANFYFGLPENLPAGVYHILAASGRQIIRGTVVKVDP